MAEMKYKFKQLSIHLKRKQQKISGVQNYSVVHPGWEE